MGSIELVYRKSPNPGFVLVGTHQQHSLTFVLDVRILPLMFRNANDRSLSAYVHRVRISLIFTLSHNYY